MPNRLAIWALLLALALIPLSAAPHSATALQPGLASGAGSLVGMPDPVGGEEGEEGTEPDEHEWRSFDRGTKPDASTARAAAPSPLTSVVTGFDGLEASNMSPSDTAGAGGDNHVLAAINSNYQLFTRDGVSEIGPLHFSALFPTSPGLKFDPRVIYDPYDDHYVLIFLGYDVSEEEGYLYVVSVPDATAANQSTWCARRFDSDQSEDGHNSWLDYPGLGFDGGRIYVTGNLFDFSYAQPGAQIIAFDKAGLYDCGLPVQKKVFGPDATKFPDGGRSRTIQPAVTSGGGANAAYLMAFDTSYSSSTVYGNHLVLYRIKMISGKLTLRKVEVKTGPVGIHPFNALQQGAPAGDDDARWDAGHLELTNVFYDTARNRVYTAHAAEKDVGADGWVDMGVRWYEVRPTARLGRSTVTRKGLFGTQNTDAGYPAVATDSTGNVYIGFSRASGVGGAKEYLSSWVTVIEPGDTVPDAGNTVQLAAGDAFLDVRNGAERWGDYAAMNRDPADGSQVWVVGQIADSSAGPGTGGFLQRLDLVGFP